MLDVMKIREDFPILSNSDVCYFDSGATSLKPKAVIDAVTNFYTGYTANIHRGDYDTSVYVSNKYEETRNKVRNFINAQDAREIVFTAGATASLNMVAYGLGIDKLKKGDVILLTKLEHASSILPWYRVAEKTGAVIRFIPLNDDGSFDLKKYEECFKQNDVKIVCLSFVSNVLGYVNPIKEICTIAHKYGAIVNVDGAQAVPHIKVDVQDLDVDLLSFSAHKMCGPSGLGILYGKLSILDSMDPYMYGGGANARFDSCGNILLKKTPAKFEAGTPNVEGVLGLGAAIDYLQGIGMEAIASYEHQLCGYLIEELKKLPNVEIYNPNGETSVVAFNIKGIFAQDAAAYFNRRKIAVRTGNHCAKILVDIIGVNETIRASLAFYNTREEVDHFISVIKETTLEKCVEAVL